MLEDENYIFILSLYINTSLNGFYLALSGFFSSMAKTFKDWSCKGGVTEKDDQ